MGRQREREIEKERETEKGIRIRKNLSTSTLLFDLIVTERRRDRGKAKELK